MMQQQEPFYWSATLRSGTVFNMGDVLDGEEVSSSQLNLDEVSAITLFPLQTDGKPITVRIDLEHGERFVRFWRQLIAAKQQTRINVIGIKAHTGIEYRLYVFPNGRIVMSSSDLYESLLEEVDNG